jgi:LysM repeat protein
MQFVCRKLFCFIVVFVAALLVGALNLHAEIIYNAKKGDSLTGIAKQHGVSLSALAARNDLRSTDQLIVGQRLIIPATNAEPKKVDFEYVVKPGDSIATIAEKFRVAVSALVEHNHIREPDKIKAGQRLRIPGAAPTVGSTGLTADLKAKLDRTTVSSKRWKNIVIHHSGTTLDTLSSMDRYHRNERHMENGLAYHFVIGNGVRTKDGEIYIGQRWSKQLDGGHLVSSAQNRISIGICLVGDFNKRAPSEKQLESLRELTVYLLNRCGLSKANVQTHRQINARPTQCPGGKFPTSKFLATLP